MGKRKKILTVMLVVLLSIGVCIPVSGAITESAQIHESAGNLFIWDEIAVDEELESKGDVYAISDKVGLNGSINGSVIIVGSKIDIRDTEIKGNIRAVGSYLNISSKEVKNITAAAADIFIEKETVANGVYLSGSNIKFYGEANEVRILGDTVVVKGKVNGDLYVNCTSLTIEEGAQIEGSVFVQASNRPIIKGDFDQDKIEFKRVENDNKQGFVREAIEKIPGVIIAILLSIILLILLKTSVEDVVESTEDRFATLGFSGFATLIIIPIVSVISMFISITRPIGIITLMIYGVIIYLAPVIMAIIITEKYLKDTNKFILVPVVAAVVKILCGLPIVGIIVYFICMIFSFGLVIFKIINDIRNNITNNY